MANASLLISNSSKSLCDIVSNGMPPVIRRNCSDRSVEAGIEDENHLVQVLWALETVQICRDLTSRFIQAEGKPLRAR